MTETVGPQSCRLHVECIGDDTLAVDVAGERWQARPRCGEVCGACGACLHCGPDDTCGRSEERPHVWLVVGADVDRFRTEHPEAVAV